MDRSVKDCMQDIIGSFKGLSFSDQNVCLKKILRHCKRRQLQLIFKESRQLLAFDFVTFLPKEIVENIFSFLNASELSVAAVCSRQWRDHTNNSKLWKGLCKKQGWTHFGDEKGRSDLDFNVTTPSSAPHQSQITSPAFHFVPHLCETLTPLCRWKDIYIRAHHLNRNWGSGRYTVYPPLRGHKERISCMSCSGKYLVTGSDDSLAIIWDLDTHRSCHNLDHPDSVLSMAMKSNLLVTGCGDGGVRIFNVSTGKCLGELKGHSGPVNCLEFDGNKIVSAGQDKMLIIWSAASGRCLYKLEGHVDEIASVNLRGNQIVSTSWDETARVWNADDGLCTQVLLGHSEVVHCAEFDEERVVTGGGDKLIKIWSVEHGDCLCTLQGHTDDVYCVGFNEQVIVSGSADSTVRVWSWFGGSMHVLREHIGVVRCLHLSDDRLVTAGDQKKVIVWEASRGKLLNVVHRNPSLVHLMSVTSTRLIVASPEGPGSVTVMSYW